MKKIAKSASNPLVTVVVTNYNYADYVGHAIRSVQEQTYPHVQCVVVDDGSTDNSLERISKFKDILIVTKENGGQLSSDLAAFPHCKGDIILFLDADDRLYPQACELIAKAYNPRTSIIQFGLDIVRPSSSKVGSFPDTPFRALDQRAAFLKHGMFPASPCSGNAFSYKHVARMVSYVNDKDHGRNWADGYFIFSAPFTGEVEIIDQPLGAYLVHGNNVSMAGVKTLKARRNATLISVFLRTGVSYVLNPGFSEEEHYRFAAGHLPANIYRNALLLRKLGERVLPEMSLARLFFRSLRGCLVSPFLSLRKKVLDLAVLFFIALAPGAVLHRFFSDTPKE